MSRRLITTIIIFIAIITLPYWLYLPFLFIAIAILPMYWEGMIFGFLIDMLYGTGLSLPFISPMASVVLVMLLVLLPVRERIRIYV